MNIRLFALLSRIGSAYTTKQQMDCRIAMMEFNYQGLTDTEKNGLDAIKALIISSGFESARPIILLTCNAINHNLNKGTQNVKLYCDSGIAGNRHADKRSND